VSLYKFINPAQEADAASVRAFWASALGDEAVRANRIENQDFVLGFCDGALDVWVKVRGKL
jgi:hypothetical protein